MEKRIVLATHGRFSEGIKTSLQMIFGDAVPIECITAYVDSEVDYAKEFERIVSAHDPADSELIVLTDVLGGSVNNEFMQLLETHDFHLITGLNLALLLEIAACPAENLSSQLPAIVERAKDHILYCNPLVKGGSGNQEDVASDDF